MNLELKRLYYNLDLLRTLKIEVDHDTVCKALAINTVLESILSKHERTASFITIEDITADILRGFNG